MHTPLSSNFAQGEITVLKAIAGPAAILNESGEVEFSNLSPKKDLPDSKEADLLPREGHYLAFCERAVQQGDENALRISLELRKVLGGTRCSSSLNIHRRQPVRTWYRVSISTMGGESRKRVLLVFHDISSQMETIHSLRESEERYRQHFKHSVSGVLIGDPDGRILDANPAACRMLGYSKEELCEGGRPLIVDPGSETHHEMMRIRKKKSFFEGEKEYLHKNGRTIPVQISSVLYRDNHGKESVLNTFRDKSDEQQARLSLEEERRFSQTSLNSIPGVFFVINTERKLIRWNHTIPLETGFSHESLYQKEFFDIFSPDQKHLLSDAVQKAFQTGKADAVSALKTVTHKLLSCHLHFKRFTTRGEQYLVVTGIDITDFIESERQRQKHQSLMEQLFDNAPLAMVMIDSESRVLAANNGFQELFGYREKEITGQNVNRLIVPGTHYADAERVSARAFEGESHQQETVRMTCGGTSVPVLVNTVPVLHQKKVIAAYGIYVDLRDQKQLEQKLQISLREKEILIREVHHRVKNNLAIITGLLELQMMQETHPPTHEQLQRIHGRIYSIAKIHEILYQHENISSIPFNKYLKKQVEFIREQPPFNKQNIHLHTGEDPPLVLNLNQAVPLALMINEFVNLGCHAVPNSLPVEIFLDSAENDITVRITGLSYEKLRPLTVKTDTQTLQQTLIRAFLQQINAQAELHGPENGNLHITFKKADHVRGANSLIDDRYGSVRQIAFEK